jgi:hypothetical protein
VANHIRRQIREAVATAVTGLTTTSTRVFQSRVYPAQTSELPCLLIYTRSESTEPISIHNPKTTERRLQLEIVALAKAVSDLDDTLDGICKEVEIALATWEAAGLGGLARSIDLLSTEFDLQGEGEKPLGSATMVFQVVSFTQSTAPDVAL